MPLDYSRALLSQRRIGRIVSGGQTGADQGGLEAARRLHILSGGFAPEGWLTEDGPAPWLATKYGLQEYGRGYAPRTERNAELSDFTLLCGNPDSSGSKLTRKLCLRHGRPLFILRDPSDSREIMQAQAALREAHSQIMSRTRDDAAWARLHSRDYFILNIAGNRESVTPGIQAATANAVYHLVTFYHRDIGWRG